ncbi:MAG: glycosyltransferase [Acidobacteria bacterium]|nr:glycosyltransferase [Acidobacteriota bacterium]
MPLLLALLVTGNASAFEEFTRGMFDDTFAGVHKLAPFDYALLIPYFAVLIALSFFGMHRYEMIRGYFKGRKNLPSQPPSRFEELPPITVQLPLFNERFVVERLIEQIVKLDYPRHLLQIQVLDDSTDETHPFTERLVAEYRAAGHPIEYHHRTNRHGFKAGALQEGLKSATGEIVAVFDADFIVPEDFLKKTVHYFADPKVGVVQTRWTYLNTHYNTLTEVQTILLDGHFVLEHVARAGAGLFFNFNGTAGLLRVKMIEDAGGWQHDTLTEDSDLSYRAQLKGWKFMYCPDVECPSELPFDMHGFQVQQTRWSKGLTQCAKKLLPMILKSDQPWRVKLEAICHLTPNIAYPLMLIMSALMLPVMIVRFYMGWMQMVFVDIPLMAASFWSISAFYLVAQKQLHPTTWKRSIWHMPALMAAGVALTLSNAKAVMEALIGYQTAFARTPKYAVGDKKVKLGNDRYKSRLGWLPYVEIAAGSWFVLMMVYAIESYNFLALPFLSLFVGGYYWAAFSKFWFDYQQRMAWQKQRQLALESAR